VTTHLHDEFLDPFFGAVVEATEEAVIDSLFVADTVVGRDGHCLPGLPVARTLELLGAAGRLAAR
jgi:D-aminopeptidase